MDPDLLRMTFRNFMNEHVIPMYDAEGMSVGHMGEDGMFYLSASVLGSVVNLAYEQLAATDVEAYNYGVLHTLNLIAELVNAAADHESPITIPEDFYNE